LTQYFAQLLGKSLAGLLAEFSPELLSRYLAELPA